jgi:DNA-binding transcriptional LysR family regulator
MRSMDLRQLEHFLAVAEERHFTRAAQRVHIVQSALSASIRRLEGALGTPLFERSTRRVELTAAGRLFQGEARRVLAAARDAREAMAAFNGVEQGRLTLGAVQSLAAFIDLPELLARFHRQHPGIEISLVQSGAGNLLERMHAGEVDLVCVPRAGDLPAGVSGHGIAREPLVLACAPEHPLSGAGRVSLADLAALPFVDFQAGWGTRRLVDAAFAAAGLRRRVAFEVGDPGIQLDLVAHGLGVALVPEAMARARAAAPRLPIAVVATETRAPRWELVVAHMGRQPANPAAGVFLGMLLRAHARDRRQAPGG